MFPSAPEHHEENTPPSARRGLGRAMEGPFRQTLSFVSLEVLVLVEEGPLSRFGAARFTELGGEYPRSECLDPALELCCHRLSAHSAGPQLEAGRTLHQRSLRSCPSSRGAEQQGLSAATAPSGSNPQLVTVGDQPLQGLTTPPIKKAPVPAGAEGAGAPERAWRDSNPRHSEPESDALSI